MIRQKKLKKKLTVEKQEQERFTEAKRNFEKIQTELAPFIKTKKIGKGYSTVGKWCESLVLCEK